MKVIFLKDVPRVGKKHEIKEVADGFAYNNLIPRKLAAPATAEGIRRAETERASSAHARDVKENTVREITAKTKETPLKIEAPANEQGHLFKGLRAADIVLALKAEYGVTFSEKDVLLPQPLKEAGVHAVPLRSGGVDGVCTLLIEAKKK